MPSACLIGCADRTSRRSTTIEGSSTSTNDWPARITPETASAKENVANALGRLQRFDESIPLLESVLAVRRAKAGEDAAVTARTMGNLAAHEMQAGRLDRAQAWFDKALPSYAKAYGTDHPDYANVLANYAALKRKQSQPARAEELLRQALAIRVAKLGEEHLSLAKTRFELGTLLLERSAYDEAESLLTRAYEIRAKQLGRHQCADSSRGRLARATLHSVGQARQSRRAQATSTVTITDSRLGDTYRGVGPTAMS